MMIDVETGLEHLGRGAAISVDRLVVVMRPGRRSIGAAHQIRKLAGDLGMTRLSLWAIKFGLTRTEK